MNNGRYDSYCGIYCGACENVDAKKRGQLAELAKRAEKPVEQLDCDGCKSEVITQCCVNCKIRACAVERGYETCVECAECPCGHFEPFKKGDFYPLYVLMMNNLKTTKRTGLDAWLKERKKRWSCADCGTPFWWYQKTCDDCGAKLYDCEAEAEDLRDAQ